MHVLIFLVHILIFFSAYFHAHFDIFSAYLIVFWCIKFTALVITLLGTFLHSPQV
jgi:hypothetical protein